ncbi:unnamed protein product [Oppiella nova]|uniref:Excinuclease ABC subunit C n=1 Tax=Oppiella nova TaxID=334625 RepID=A0A7R9L8P8_9ACAR|nr:unnamed protein product [Oppiella nova]CAG2159538.1 unnamed protein product [Oppiella nova]
MKDGKIKQVLVSPRDQQAFRQAVEINLIRGLLQGEAKANIKWIKRCTAPCVGLISAEAYNEDVQNSIRFLNGDTKELNQELIQKMEQAAENLEFEKAVFYRDRMALLRDVQAQQAIYKVKGEADILAIAYQAGVTCVQIMHVRNGKMLGGKSYFPDMLDDDLGQMLSDFIANFYFQVADEVPAELIVNVNVTDRKELEEALHQQFEKKIQIKHNVRETRAEWLELAEMNVQHAIKGKLANHLELNERFHQLEQVCGRPVDRGARKRDYRQFAIEDITGGDDYAAMRQALTRRYKKAMLPDLLLIDGGKGQLHMAMEVMQELGLDAFMVGVSKGEGRKPGLETLHFTDGTKIQLPEDHKALHLIQQVRDEAHRFAITKHRAKRDKRRGGSVLEAIPGLGPKRRRDLLTHFGGIQGYSKDRKIGQIMSLESLFQQIEQEEWIDIPQGWLQGRTIFGGLVAETPVKLTAEILRQGKSVTTIETLLSMDMQQNMPIFGMNKIDSLRLQDRRLRRGLTGGVYDYRSYPEYSKYLDACSNRVNSCFFNNCLLATCNCHRLV